MIEVSKNSDHLGIYIHWPFCLAKCPYCDFNSHVVDRVDDDEWERAFLQELTRLAKETGDRVVSSVFFGGGTPSLMSAALVGAILDQIQRHWRMVNAPEITLEANPTSVEADRFRGYRSVGVNRVSLGVQALNDKDLKALGRLHSVSEALAAVEIAQNCFERSSFDLIYARQNQSLQAWEAELRQALDLQAGHLSLYQLTIEPGTAFGARFDRGKLRGLPDEDLGADFYDLTQELCESAGLPSYEISNHCVPGNESRHNMIYWTGGDYLGVGPGAHGRMTLGGSRFATECPRAPSKWLKAVSAGKSEDRTRLTGPEQAEEYLMMGLRISDGISLSKFASMGGAQPSDPAVRDLIDLGLIKKDGDSLSATKKGRPLLNYIIQQILT